MWDTDDRNQNFLLVPILRTQYNMKNAASAKKMLGTKNTDNCEFNYRKKVHITQRRHLKTSD